MTSALVRSTCRSVPSYWLVLQRTVATAPKAATPVTPESLINEQRPQSKESKDHQRTKKERLSTTKEERQARTSNSFVMNLFRGQFHPNEVFPYPNVLNEEQKENVKMLLDPISKFFEEKNDPDKNDKAEKVFLR